MQQPGPGQTKGYVMVQYTPLGGQGSASSQYEPCCGHASAPPPAVLGRCPKLTRYKTLAFVGVALLSLLLTLMAARTQVTRPYREGGAGEEGLPAGGGATENSPAASPMCSLRVPQDLSLMGVGEGGAGETVGVANTDSGLAGVVGQMQKEQGENGDSVGNPGEEEDAGMNEVHAYPSERYEHNPNRRRIKRFPSAIVIGARKAGTRAVLRFVDLHPDVVTSNREPHFFDKEYDRGLEWYRQQMPLSLPTQLTMEKTPNYLVDWDVPERVYRFNESIKLILIVRDPISRAVSDYVQLREAHYKQMAETEEKAYNSDQLQPFPHFEELAVNPSTGEINKSYAPIKRSLYSRHLERWLAFFNMSQILVLDGDNIRYRPWQEMARVEKFLGLSHQIKEDCFVFNKTKGFFCIKMVDKRTGSDVTFQKCLAESKGREHPPIDSGVRRKLREFFQPFNRRFFSRIGRTFQWD